jgi:pyruvate dehydrogenase E1 component
MDSLFPELKIYASQGQKYEPVDHEMLLSYTESTDGQILEEGITEAGSMSSFIASGTSYSTRGVPTVPFYTFYSMFGFQRVGDLIWQAADSRTRGFLLGATAGRTTLSGEGLQHQDGHSLVLASTVPACQSYDPAFAYEVAAIVKHGLNRMYGGGVGPNGETDPDVFYYLTLYNENYVMPSRPEGVADADIVSGLYRWRTVQGSANSDLSATLLFSGSSHGAVDRAADVLASKYDVKIEVWSATSYKTLREEALSVERSNRLNPTREAAIPRVTRQLDGGIGPIVAVSDFMKVVPEQIARFVPSRRFTPLGTDGMGRSDTREALRRHFEIDTEHIVITVLAALGRDGKISMSTVENAIRELGVDPSAIDPYLV